MVYKGWLGNLDPFGQIARFQRDMNNLFETHRWQSRSARAREYPPLNVSRDENELIVSVELPGMSMENVQLSLTGDTLSIKGERKTMAADAKDVAALRTERPAGGFMRTIELPERTNPDKAEARYANGVLTVRIPKDEAARPRRIEVKAS